MRGASRTRTANCAGASRSRWWVVVGGLIFWGGGLSACMRESVALSHPFHVSSHHPLPNCITRVCVSHPQPNPPKPNPQRVLREKEELLAKAHEEHKERITLLKRLQDLEMDNADLKLIMQKSYMAEVGGLRGLWVGLWLGGVESDTHTLQQLQQQLNDNNRRRSTTRSCSCGSRSWRRRCR